MTLLARYLKKYLNYFNYFYSFIGNKIFVSFFLNILVAILDGFGIAMFLPLLSSISNSQDISDLGKLSFIVIGMEAIGIPKNLFGILSIMLFFFILKGIVKYIEGIYKTILQRQFITNLRLSHIDFLSKLNYKAFIESDNGKIQNTITGEVYRVVTAYTAYFQTIQGALMVLVYIFLAFTVDFQFTLLVVAGGWSTSIIYKRIYNKTKKHSVDFTESSSDFQGLLIQYVASFKYLKASGMINKYKNKLVKKINEIEISQKKIGELNALINALREPLVVFVIFLVIIVEVEVFNGELSLIVLSLLFFYRALTYLMSLQNYWNTFMATFGSLENMKDFNQKLSFGKESTGDLIFNDVERRIEFKNVSVKFKEKTVLNNINFSINKNDIVALIGPSGSGKSTILNLLAGLIFPDEGQILLDGNSIKDFDINSFNSQIGYITQEPVIFDDTVFNNVTFWAEKNEENLKKFNSACRKALIDDFIISLEKKEDSRLGNNGVMISGGQRQRIAIAREFFKDIKILLMDEGTSSLDLDTEKLIQENIDSLKGRLTIILATHRESALNNCDRLFEIKNRVVKEIKKQKI